MSAERRDGAGGRAVTAFSFLFAYLLSFLFEGRALYALLEGGGGRLCTLYPRGHGCAFSGAFHVRTLCKGRPACKGRGLDGRRRVPAADRAVLLCALAAVDSIADCLRIRHGLRRGRVGVFFKGVYAKKRAPPRLGGYADLFEHDHDRRQRHIHVRFGKGNREIALESGISENTVKTHLKSIFSKYAVSSRAELISLLLRSREA